MLAFLTLAGVLENKELLLFNISTELVSFCENENSQIKEVINQIKINKSKNNLGIVFWSFNELKNNPELSKALVDEHFKN